MNKRAFYIEYPDKGFATIIRDDAEDSVISTAEKPDSDSYIAYLQQEGYEVIAFISSGYEYPGIGRTRRKWHRIDVNHLGIQEVSRSFTENIEAVEMWEKEDEEAYDDIVERRQRVLGLVPSA